MYFLDFEFRKLIFCILTSFVIVPGGFSFSFWGNQSTLPPPPQGTPMRVMCHKSMHVAYQMKALESRNQNLPD